MKNGKNRRILAVDPGTRQMGIAILEEEGLLYHDVRTIKKRRSPHEILKEGKGIISRYISDYRPQVLAFEKAFFAQNRNTAVLNALVDEIRILGRRRNLEVIGLSPSTVKRIICGDGSAKKNQVAKVVASVYPELRVFLAQNRKWKTDFNSNRFDAIAVGLVASQMEGKKGKSDPKVGRK